MKILWISNVPSPYRVDFFNKLGKEIELTVLFEMNNAADRNINWKPGAFQNFEGVVLHGIRSGADSSLCINILRWLRKSKYQIIIVSNYSTPTGMIAIQWMKLRKIMFVIEADGGFYKGGVGIKEKLKRYLISSAKYWLSSGAKTTEYLIAYGANQNWIYEFPFSSVIQSDILQQSIKMYDKQVLRKQLKIEGERIVIAVGQFIYRKGFDTLLRAWTRMRPNYTLLIIGGGELEAEYRTMVKNFELHNIHIIGFKQKEELLKYFRASDLFVLPTREDIWGLVVNEAMACGLPVITTDKCIAGIELVEDNKNGFIVHVDDELELYKKMEYIISDDEIRENMARYSLDVIQRYTIEAMVETHFDIFKEIIGEK